MKRKNLLVSLVFAGLQSLTLSAFAMEVSNFPADAEASYDLPALESRADYYARVGEPESVWGVSRRVVTPHDPFPFGGGYIDD